MCYAVDFLFTQDLLVRCIRTMVREDEAEDLGGGVFRLQNMQ